MAAQHQHEGRMVAGLFHNAPDAERAVRTLRAVGFDKNDIGLATRDRTQREWLDQRTGMDVEASGAKAAQSGARGLLETIASWFSPTAAAGSRTSSPSRASRPLRRSASRRASRPA